MRLLPGETRRVLGLLESAKGKARIDEVDLEEELMLVGVETVVELEEELMVAADERVCDVKALLDCDEGCEVDR